MKFELSDPIVLILTIDFTYKSSDLFIKVDCRLAIEIK
jgi:hypothetical protein